MNNFWDTTIPAFDYPDNFRKIYDIFYISQRKKVLMIKKDLQ